MAEKHSPETGLNEKLMTLSAQVAAAFVSHNNVTASELPELISTIYSSLSRIGSGQPGLQSRPDPAVPVKKSIFPDYIICLEDGKKLKMLKRHIKTSYNLTPDQYRERWNLGSDYPMVAPNYAKQRSKLAKQIGLGTSRRTISRKAA